MATLTLHYHPLSSYCMKALIGLYELELPFDKHLVDLGDPLARAALIKLWPVGKFPVLRDEARARTVPESTVILEYLDLHHGRGRLLPLDPDRALACRLTDRFYDQYVHTPMQQIVADRLRPPSERDPFGVAQARARLAASYAIADAELRETGWASGDAFTLADCAAAPALFYAHKLVPIVADAHPRLAAYFARVLARPSFARVLEEARPYFAMFPSA